MTTPLEAAGINTVGTKTTISGPLDHLDRGVVYGERVVLVVDAIVTGIGLKKSGNGPIEARSLTLLDGFEVEGDEGRRIVNTLRTARSLAAQVGAGKEVLPGLEGLTDVAGVVDVDTIVGTRLLPGAEPQDLNDVWEALPADVKLEVEALWLELGEAPLTLARAIAIRDELDVLFVKTTDLTPGPIKVLGLTIDRDELNEARAWVEDGFPLYLAEPTEEELLEALASLGDSEGPLGYRRLEVLERVYQHRGAILDALSDYAGASRALLAETEPWDGYAKASIGASIAELVEREEAARADGSWLRLLEHVSAFEAAHRDRKGIADYIAPFLDATPAAAPPPAPEAPPLPEDDLNLDDE